MASIGHDFHLNKCIEFNLMLNINYFQKLGDADAMVEKIQKRNEKRAEKSRVKMNKLKSAPGTTNEVYI